MPRISNSLLHFLNNEINGFETKFSNTDDLFFSIISSDFELVLVDLPFND